MIKTVSRALLAAVFASVIFASVAALTSPAFLQTAEGWAQSSMSTTSPPKIVVPKAVRDYLKQNASELASGDVLSASKQTEQEKGQVIEHTYGGNEHSYEQTYVARQYLTLVTKADKITIKKVVGNRGNCQLESSFGSKDLPAELRFGEALKLYVACTSLIEVEADTNLGPIKFEWDN